MKSTNMEIAIKGMSEYFRKERIDRWRGGRKKQSDQEMEGKVGETNEE